jgi:hypothetical protein
MHIVSRAAVFCAAALVVAGCDSFRGAQEPLETAAAQVSAATRNYGTEAAIDAYYSPTDALRGGLSRQEYRDKVVALRLIAIEARYQAFIQELRAARTGVGLGADIITLVLGGLGTIIADTTTKTVLAAATATVAGSRVSFDKNLFYDQTLPAIVAQMDAARASQILLIRQAMAKDTSVYPLPDALVDLRELERLGSIDTAIKNITASATKQADDAQANLKRYTLIRTAGDQKYMLSSTGQALTVTLTKAVDSLPEERAIALATNPPIANATVDPIALGMIATAGGRLSAAQAKAILRMRINNALNEAELQAWSKALQ